MELKIITSLYTKEYLISYVQVSTAKGSYVIQRGHAPTILLLTEKNTVSFVLSNGKTETIIVNSGFLETQRNSITLVTDAII